MDVLPFIESEVAAGKLGYIELLPYLMKYSDGVLTTRLFILLEKIIFIDLNTLEKFLSNNPILIKKIQSIIGANSTYMQQNSEVCEYFRSENNIINNYKFKYSEIGNAFKNALKETDKSYKKHNVCKWQVIS